MFAGSLVSPYGYSAPYSSSKLTVTSPPQSFNEPLTLAEVKSYLKVPLRSPADSDEDALISSLISGARVQAEIAQRRDLVVKMWDMSLDYWTDYQIEVGAPPLVSVASIQYKDIEGIVTTLVENVDYIVDTAKRPGIVAPAPNMTWPFFTSWPSSAITIRYTAGITPSDPWWTESGALVKNGMRLLISAWYNNRIPFEIGASAMAEYPYAVTTALNFGAVPSVV